MAIFLWEVQRLLRPIINLLLFNHAEDVKKLCDLSVYKKNMKDILVVCVKLQINYKNQLND